MALLKVELEGSVNVGADVILRNMAAAVRRPLPQARPYTAQHARVALVGGGPSLESTERELRDLVFDGAKVVAVNGAAAWLTARNIRPHMQVVLDARASNARFVAEAVPQCRYMLASQCAPETFDACAGRDVTLWHVVGGEDEKRLLDEWYDGHYYQVGGGTTVMLRAIMLLRMLGFVRMDVFGMDSCWLPDTRGTLRHHAYGQPENDGDKAVRVWLVPRDPRTGEQMLDRRKAFMCDPWHMKQWEDFQATLAAHGDSFLLNVHGDGLIAESLRMGAALSLVE
jgi:hypothetical protein